jgi:hypothetical protein
MKRALVFGGGSKFGANISLELSNRGYIVDAITSSDLQHHNVNIIKVIWKDFDYTNLTDLLDKLKVNNYDLIIFNQNSKLGPADASLFQPGELRCPYPVTDWSRGIWTDGQLPYYVVSYLNELICSDTKVVWMLTGLINPFASLSLERHVAYRCIKMTSYYIMQAFSKNRPGIFFGIDPGHIDGVNDKISHCASVIERIFIADHSYNGEVYNIDKDKFWAPLGGTE